MGKIQVSKLPMGLRNSPNIFRQEMMSILMSDLEFVHICLNDHVVMTVQNHSKSLEWVYQRLTDAGLKVIGKKSFFHRPKLKQLGYWINEFNTIAKKMEAI
jgi:hypothetical protein